MNEQNYLLPQLSSIISQNVQLKADSHLTQLLVDYSQDAIVCVDCKGNIAYVNQTACSLMKQSREQLLTLKIDEINLVFFKQNWQDYWQFLEDHGSLYFLFSPENREVQENYWEITGSYLQYGEQKYACLIFRDLKQYKQIQSALIELNQKTEKKESSFTKVYLLPNKQSQNDSFFPNSSALKNVFQYIEEHYQQPITLSDVAEAVGYSPAYLTHLVKRRTKRSVLNWIVERRMLKARQLLLNTDRSVTEIAATVGYPDACYFSRRFTQLHNISPKTWREQHRAS